MAVFGFFPIVSWLVDSWYFVTLLYDDGIGVFVLFREFYGYLLGYVVIICWFPLGTILAVLSVA